MRILVVEDEKEIRDYLKRTLEAQCYAVDIAEDGERGLYLSRVNEYDAIIMDNMMPKISGLDLCLKIREDENKVPILMLSVASATTTKVDLLNAGADDYLTKPFSFDELVARLKALLRRPKNIEEDVLQIDNLVIDLKRHKVKRGKKEIYLTRKEFALLEYLLRNQDVVLSRSMIMEHVWDMSIDPFSNTIESHIASLRRKVDLPEQKKLIQTVSGRGYRVCGM